jgi:hypothetical protein
MFQVFHMFSNVYVVDILSACFKSRSCVVDRCPPSTAGASSWFTCRRLRPTDTSTACIHKQGRWAQGVVPLCGRVMGAGRGSRLWRWLGTGRSTWDVMRARGAGGVSGCGPRAGRPDASLNHKLIVFLIKATSTFY